MLGVAEVDQGVQPGHRLEDDVAALTAVAAVRAAIFDIFFPPETDRAGTAPAGLDVNLRLIKKMHRAPIAVYAAELNRRAAKAAASSETRRGRGKAARPRPH